jgi:hypothetical protein
MRKLFKAPFPFVFMPLLFLFFVIPMPRRCIVIRTDDGVARFVKFVQNGDTVRLSHINSIYDAEVTEILEVDKDRFRLLDVETISYGVREYYGITDGVQERSWKKISFYNSKGRQFSLLVDNSKVDILKKYSDAHLSMEIGNFSIIGYLLLLFDCIKG